MDFESHYLSYKQLVDERLQSLIGRSQPASLYEPTHYVLSGGGKRIRAILVMLAAEAVGGSGPAALDAGVGVEILHNFTLVHDDIMDSAATRRGRATVHTRWDEGTAILVGDVMIGLAHKTLLATQRPPHLVEVLLAFTQGIIDVCEGQSLDREFELRHDVTLDDYMHMIGMKTGRLVETAAEVGGWIGDGTAEQIAGLRAYARHIGQAFQIQDDLLDITAKEAELGKKLGGDVIEGKKTYLLVRALERVHDGADRELLETLLANKGLPESRIPEMRDLYERHGILDAARADVADAIEAAKRDLRVLADTPARDMLVWFAHMLMNRSK
ncbi:MAG TPA: polyprenyl synthetase family protein [Candidatus Kapabacteria bacterium]|nr:polyprenyl synthetase family protein [Candidatus Kapabacteria bacterium]